MANTIVEQTTTVVVQDQSTPNTVEVSDNDTVVVTEPQVSGITVSVPGSQGPAGDVGTDKTYTHTQGAASSVWTIAHNLGKLPAVTVIDTGNNTVIGDVNYIDNNNVQITFQAAFTGKATFN